MIIKDLFHTVIRCNKYNVNVNEDITINISCIDYDGNPVIRKGVSVYYDDELIDDTLVTNNDGEVSLTYTCENFGLHTIRANNNAIIQVYVGGAYPVGSIYISVNNVNPSELFGGEWEKIESRFLLASGGKYNLGAMSGSADAVVVSHNHTQNGHSHIPGTSRAFLTAPAGSGWAEIQGANISGSGYHYVATTAKKNFNVYPSASGTTTASNQATGVSGVDKNMPPYLVVNVWKRKS